MAEIESDPLRDLNARPPARSSNEWFARRLQVGMDRIYRLAVTLPYPPHHLVVFHQHMEDFGARLVTRCTYTPETGRRFSSRERTLNVWSMLASERRAARHQEAIAAYRDLREEVRLFNLATQPYSRQWEAK